ncbi:MAG: tol-pal system protein YbgF [Granulosicoccus sp.]
MNDIWLKNAIFLPLALALTGLFAPSSVLAQARPTIESIDSRVSRIERVLDQSLLEQLQRVDSLQQEIRILRGEIESLAYEVNTLKKRNSDLYADSDRRITDLEEMQGSLDFFDEDGNLVEGALLDETSGFLDETAGDGAFGGDSDAVKSTPAPAAVIVSEGGPAIPVSNLEEFGDGPKPPTGVLRDTATNAEKLAYNSAYDQLARGQVQESTKSFDSFLTQYPDGPYSDNAWYWQGEAMYAARDFEKSLRNFGVVINAFPNSPKVPDARLKIGFALFEQQQYDQARAILTGVQDDYPGRSASVLARKRLQRMDREGL